MSPPPVASPVDELLETVPDLGAASPLPAHARIEQWLVAAIGAGTLVPGDKLPREESLAAAIGVSRMTLRQALAAWRATATILRKPGRLGGTFVAEPKIVCDLTGLAGFTEQMRRAHVRAGARLVRATTRQAGRAARRGRSGWTAATRCTRSCGSGRPTGSRSPWSGLLSGGALPRPARPAADRLDLHAARLPATTSPAHRHRGARAGDRPAPSRPQLLRVDEGSPLMLIERTAYTASGVAVEFARDVFRADRTRITMRTGLGQTPALQQLTGSPNVSRRRGRGCSSGRAAAARRPRRAPTRRTR